jgi:hypothetical protein
MGDGKLFECCLGWGSCDRIVHTVQALKSGLEDEMGLKMSFC